LVVRSINAPIRCGTTDPADSFAIRPLKQPKREPKPAGQRLPQAALFQGEVVSKANFDLAFVKAMTARHRAGSKLAATELRDGTLPEARQLAQQLLADHQAQIATMTAWVRAWSKASATPPGGQTSRPSVSGRPAGTLPG
jgi:uncharacterized protein (DUF305 family)